jgi:LysR family glycine cleavage system transcriptional activator
MRKLPPLNALIAFEATARLGGVRAASDELNVTQSAVSHQIANLENYLQTLLFHRKSKRLFLTDVGKDYLRQVEPVLDSIARASADAARFSDRETLTVAAPPSLTVTWLLPRLGKFIDAFPNLNLRFLERMTLDPEEKQIDCAIEYRFQASKDLQSVLLLPDEVVPIASPYLVKKHRIRSIENLRGISLIETERRLTSWRAILGSQPWYKTQRIISVSYSLHAFQAAELSLGIALGNRNNAERYIKESRLCIPFEFKAGTVPPSPRYFLSSTAQKTNLPKVAAFSDWIRNEVCEKS